MGIFIARIMMILFCGGRIKMSIIILIYLLSALTVYLTVRHDMRNNVSSGEEFLMLIITFVPILNTFMGICLFCHKLSDSKKCRKNIRYFFTGRKEP